MKTKQSKAMIVHGDVRDVQFYVEEYEGLIEDIQAICVERVYNARHEVIMQYWDIGATLAEREDGGASVPEIMASLDTDERIKKVNLGRTSLYFALKVFRTYPDIGQLPDGKNCSITKLKKLLMAPKDKDDEPTMVDIAAKIFQKYGFEDSEKIYEELGELIAEHENS